MSVCVKASWFGFGLGFGFTKAAECRIALIFVSKGLEIRSIRCPLNSCIVPMELAHLADIVMLYSDRRGTSGL